MKTQNELVGEQIAAQIIARIDADYPPYREETGWLAELKGSAPSWAVLNPNDYDDHWTTDSTKAIRFARREDAQAFIDHNGWTAVFPSEHIWDHDRARAAAQGETT